MHALLNWNLKLNKPGFIGNRTITDILSGYLQYIQISASHFFLHITPNQFYDLRLYILSPSQIYPSYNPPSHLPVYCHADLQWWSPTAPLLHIGVVLLEFISPVRKQRYLTQPSHTVPRFSKAAFSPHGLSSRQAYIVALLSPAADTPLAAAVKFLRSGNLWNRFVVMKKDGRICPLTRFCQTFTQSFFIFLCGGADKRHIWNKIRIQLETNGLKVFCCGPPRNRCLLYTSDAADERLPV